MLAHVGVDMPVWKLKHAGTGKLWYTSPGCMLCQLIQLVVLSIKLILVLLSLRAQMAQKGFAAHIKCFQVSV